MLKVYYANIVPLREVISRERNMLLIPEARRERLVKLKSEEEQLRGLAVSVLLRIALEEEGVSFDTLEFARGAHGKPYIVDCEIYFNVSHAGEYALCAVCDQEVGVDVESLTRLDEHPNQVMRIAERILTDKERKLWEQSGMNASQLLRIWTRKESYAKRAGRGLSIGLERVDTTENAFYQERQLKDDYYMTVCTAHESEPMQVFDLTDRL